MNYVKSFRETDLEKLGQLRIFSWLSPSEVKTLGSSLKVQIFHRNEVIFRESTVATDAHVLVSGIARVTCLNGRSDRVTVALIAPGAIPGFPILPINRFEFRCEAYSNCRVGTTD
jgi:CRP-like cAMP-binding protein